jgi:cyclophilin family peptidyl-prolyl cis-trans isomerase
MMLAILFCLGSGCRPDKTSQSAQPSTPPKEPAPRATAPAANSADPSASQSTPKNIPSQPVAKSADQPAIPGLPANSWAVELKTTMGDIILVLDEKAAPVTVKNFIQYVENGFYSGTIFHRVIPKFMIQGGGFTDGMQQKPTRPAIINEASNGLKNARGTISMARTNNPNSATSQFFINHVDNAMLDFAKGSNPGYAVFGKVFEGMDVVDSIASVKTTTRGMFQNVPVESITITSAKVIQQPSK